MDILQGPCAVAGGYDLLGAGLRATYPAHDVRRGGYATVRIAKYILSWGYYHAGGDDRAVVAGVNVG